MPQVTCGHGSNPSTCRECAEDYRALAAANDARAWVSDALRGGNAEEIADARSVAKSAKDYYRERRGL
jgi:hypothetical protein